MRFVGPDGTTTAATAVVLQRELSNVPTIPRCLLVSSLALGLVLSPLAATAEPAIEVRPFPSDPIPAWPATQGGSIHDLVVHAVVVANRGDSPVRLEAVRVEARVGGDALVTVVVTAGAVAAATAEHRGMLASPMAFLAELDVPAEALGEGLRWAESPPTLAPGEAVLAREIYLAAPSLPDSVVVTADSAGGATARAEVGVSAPPEPAWKMPLEGVWLTSSLPSPASHHRFHWQTEFAVDFWKVGPDGLAWSGPMESAEAFHGFGAPVLAAADGTVVTVENGATQDWEARRRREGETDEERGRRLQRLQLEAMRDDPRPALMGNHVVLRHPNGLYTTYGHLRTGSVRVRVGDEVKAGQPIAEVGDTGDTPLVHLHFQVNAGPDPLASRSLPFRFTDTRARLDPGVFLGTE